MRQVVKFGAVLVVGGGLAFVGQARAPSPSPASKITTGSISRAAASAERLNERVRFILVDSEAPPPPAAGTPTAPARNARPRARGVEGDGAGEEILMGGTGLLETPVPTKVHPLAAQYPDDFLVICEAGCRPETDRIVYKVSKVAAASAEIAKRRLEVTSVQPQPQASEVTGTDLVCVAGCYDRPVAPAHSGAERQTSTPRVKQAETHHTAPAVKVPDVRVVVDTANAPTMPAAVALASSGEGTAVSSSPEAAALVTKTDMNTATTLATNDAATTSTPQSSAPSGATAEAAPQQAAVVSPAAASPQMFLANIGDAARQAGGGISAVAKGVLTSAVAAAAPGTTTTVAEAAAAAPASPAPSSPATPSVASSVTPPVAQLPAATQLADVHLISVETQAYLNAKRARLAADAPPSVLRRAVQPTVTATSAPSGSWAAHVSRVALRTPVRERAAIGPFETHIEVESGWDWTLQNTR